MELELIRASEFIRLTADGRFDLASSKLALAVIAKSCRKRGIDRAMLDLRGAHVGPKPIFTPKDLSALVDTFHEFGFTRNLRLALLYIRDPHGRARMFSFISLIRGWQVRGFDSFESAMLWLSDEPIERAALRAGERPIPIRPAGHLEGATGNRPKGGDSARKSH